MIWGGDEVVSILEALGLHGYKLFLVCLVIAALLVWLAWQIGTWGLKKKRV